MILIHLVLIHLRNVSTMLGQRAHLGRVCAVEISNQDLIDNKMIQFDNMAEPNVITNPLLPYTERNENAISIVEEKIPDFSSP